MNHNSRRAAARAIAITRADESRTRKAVALKLTILALFAVAALAAVPSVWSF